MSVGWDGGQIERLATDRSKGRVTGVDGLAPDTRRAASDLSRPEERGPGSLTAMRESMVTAVTSDAGGGGPGPAGALGRFAPPSPSRPRSARENKRCSLSGSTGLPALRALSCAAQVDLREMRLGSGAGHAP